MFAFIKAAVGDFSFSPVLKILFVRKFMKSTTES